MQSSEGKRAPRAVEHGYGAVDDVFLEALRSRLRGTACAVVARGECTGGAAGRSEQWEEVEEAGEDRSYHEHVIAECVVRPTCTDDVVRVMQVCSLHRVPVVVRGAGTGLEGGCVPYYGGVVLCTDGMREVRVLKEDMLAVVGPGVRKNELNAELKRHTLLLGPDPASNPSLGGMVSTSGSGLSTLKYGTTRENVVSLQVVTPAGRVIRTRPAVRKSSTGYDLTDLYVGSEGTLGVVTEVTVRVHPLLPCRNGAVVVFESVGQAATTVVALKRASLHSLVRCELLNTEQVGCANNMLTQPLEVAPTLFLEFQGSTPGICDDDRERARAVIAGVIGEGVGGGDGGSGAARKWWMASNNEKELDELWSARRECYVAARFFSSSDGKPRTVFISDVCVPLSKLAQCISETEQDFKSSGLPCLICAHISDGNFHCLVPYSPHEKGLVHELEQRLMERAVSFGGAVSGEHGVGIGKMHGIEMEHGAYHVQLQRDIKRALDPLGIMNPNKIFLLHGHSAKL